MTVSIAMDGELYGFLEVKSDQNIILPFEEDNPDLIYPKSKTYNIYIDLKDSEGATSSFAV